MNATVILLTLVLGLILLALEVAVLPGGVAGVFGALLICFGTWQSYLLWGTTIGSYILLGSTLLIALFVYFFVKSKTWNKFALKEVADTAVNQVNVQTIKVGTRGTTVARLAPTGMALLDGQKVEVHAVNAFIDPEKPIEVIAVDGYRIDVREITDERFN